MRDTNVGAGFCPCRKNCTCCECTIEKLGRRIAELLGDSISREQQIASLQAENAKLRKATIRLYNSGYHAGHHDTVEGGYTDILQCDMDTYHDDVVAEILSELEV
jgi:hypothetical protein